jgi:FAD/FMN-containing dehydrogenase
MIINLAKLSGGTTAIPGEMLDGLKSRIRGTILTERDDGYTAARSVWNAMIDRRPAIIVRCAGAADVKEAVRFARDAGCSRCAAAATTSPAAQSATAAY